MLKRQGKHRFFLLWLSIATCFFCLLVNHASAAVDSDKNKQLGLTLSPKSCVLEDAKTCDLPIDVWWWLQDQQNVCLFITPSDLQLACWQNAQTQKSQFYLQLDRSTLFELRREDDNKLIYSEPFTVFKKVKRLRRQRRNPWSFY